MTGSRLNIKSGCAGAGFGRPARMFFMALVAIVLFALSSLPAQAADCSPEETLRWRGGTLRVENDLVAGTDKNYTNGVSLTLISHDLEDKLRPRCLPMPVSLYARLLNEADSKFSEKAGAETAGQNLVVRIGQNMYTPEDMKRTDLIENDRPYAGLLYMGLGWNRRVHPEDRSYEMLDQRELTLGVIGPMSLAREAQNLVHDIRGFERFDGWDNQLGNEPALLLTMERKYKPYVRGAVHRGWGADAVGGWALRLGNIETSASVSLELRAGRNIPNDFGSYSIRPGAENRPPSSLSRLAETRPDSSRAPRPGIHAFLNMEAKAVGWDFSLDGNLFRKSHSVDRKPLVAQAAAGFSSQWIVGGHGMRLAFMRVWRTREFGQQSERAHSFGSVAFSMDF